MSTIYLFNYNNQFNRIVKRRETAEEYPIYSSSAIRLTNTNFNPNNGIITSHIFNTSQYEEGSPDYCLVCDEANNIKSRWFVTEFERTRGSQYKVILARDLAADYKNELLNCVAFVRKGWLNNGSPLIFNNENMGFNQIKKGEYLLKNNLNTPWLVLYLSRYHTGEGGTYEYNEYTGGFHDEIGDSTDYTYANLSDYPYFRYSESPYNYTEDLRFDAYYKDRSGSQSGSMYSRMALTPTSFTPNVYAGTGGASTLPIAYTKPTYPGDDIQGAYARLMQAYHQYDSSTDTGLPINTILNLGSEEGLNILLQEQGKTIKVGTKVYTIAVEYLESSYASGGTYVNQITGLADVMTDIFYRKNNISLDGYQPSLHIQTSASYSVKAVKLSIVESVPSDNSIKYDIKYEGSVTTDSVYEILAAPLNDIVFKISDAKPRVSHSGRIAMQWFQDIINKYNGAGWAYDLQIVPYCPIDTTDLSTFRTTTCYTQASPSSDKFDLAVAVKVPKASFSLRLGNFDIPTQSDYKLWNETTVYRLCSPNGVGEYEWSPAKNNGLRGFEIDCTLIPFNPYIKINPTFTYMYGQDYNDFRGLICGGDFSLPILNDQWSTYALNNKYYQQIFDRTIEHQEFNNKYQGIQDKVQASVGTLQGGLSGATAGGMVGGPIGAGVGAVTGLISSGITGGMDVYINEKLRREELDFQKDRFGYELGTIKARGNTLTRSTSYNINNKYFPYVEYYTCTPAELEALENKLIFNGMTIEIIGIPSDFMNRSQTYTFLQGDIIEININEDYEVVSALNRRFQGGLRFES